jgi:putative tricarboxylic transport membrane protein
MSVTAARPNDQPADEPSADIAPGRRPIGELGMAALLALLGVVVLIGAGGITQPGSSNTIGPRFFPYLVGAVLVVVAVALAIAVWRGDLAQPEGGEDIDPTKRMDWRAVAIVVVAFAAHALLINVVGWPLAVTLMFAGVAKVLGTKSWIAPLVAGGATSVIVWIIFVKALNVALPGGVLLEMIVGV